MYKGQRSPDRCPRWLWRREKRLAQAQGRWQHFWRKNLHHSQWDSHQFNSQERKLWYPNTSRDWTSGLEVNNRRILLCKENQVFQDVLFSNSFLWSDSALNCLPRLNHISKLNSLNIFHLLYPIVVDVFLWNVLLVSNYNTLGFWEGRHWSFTLFSGWLWKSQAQSGHQTNVY